AGVTAQMAVTVKRIRCLIRSWLVWLFGDRVAGGCSWVVKRLRRQDIVSNSRSGKEQTGVRVQFSGSGCRNPLNGETFVPSYVVARFTGASPWHAGRASTSLVSRSTW